MSKEVDLESLKIINDRLLILTQDYDYYFEDPVISVEVTLRDKECTPFVREIPIHCEAIYRYIKKELDDYKTFLLKSKERVTERLSKED